MNKVIMAITRDGECFKGVVLRRNGQRVELLQRQRRALDSRQWRAFRDELDQSYGGAEPQKIVAGLDSVSVLFYPVSVPKVATEQMQALVSLQAESVLPLSLAEMTWAWRKISASHNGKVGLTLVATRRQHLQTQVDQIRPCAPARMILDAEALVYVWHHYYQGHDDRAVVVYFADDYVQLALSQKGQLVSAVRLDQARDEFETAQGLSQSAVERLSHDVRSAMERFGGDDVGGVGVYFLADGRLTIPKIVDAFTQVNLNAHEVTRSDKIVVDAELSEQELYGFLPTLAVAAMGSDSAAVPVDLTETIYSTVAPAAKQTGFQLPSWSLVVAAFLVLLTTCLFVSYRGDVQQTEALRAVLEPGDAEVSFGQLLQANRVRQQIAAQRIDVLELLESIHADRIEGVMLDRIQFKRHQPIRLKGHASKDNQKPFEFLRKLQQAPGVTDAILEDPVYDKKKKIKTFAITFHYKKITKKK